MPKFALICNKCGKIVEGDPFTHIEDAHGVLEFFSFAPIVKWKELKRDEAAPKAPSDK